MPKSNGFCPICSHHFDPEQVEACGEFCGERCAAVAALYCANGTNRICFSCSEQFVATEKHHRVCPNCAQTKTAKPKDFRNRDVDGTVESFD